MRARHEGCSAGSRASISRGSSACWSTRIMNSLVRSACCIAQATIAGCTVLPAIDRLGSGNRSGRSVRACYIHSRQQLGMNADMPRSSTWGRGNVHERRPHPGLPGGIRQTGRFVTGRDCELPVVATPLPRPWVGVDRQHYRPDQAGLPPSHPAKAEVCRTPNVSLRTSVDMTTHRGKLRHEARAESRCSGPHVR